MVGEVVLAACVGFMGGGGLLAQQRGCLSLYGLFFFDYCAASLKLFFWVGEAQSKLGLAHMPQHCEIGIALPPDAYGSDISCCSGPCLLQQHLLLCTPSILHSTCTPCNQTNQAHTCTVLLPGTVAGCVVTVQVHLDRQFVKLATERTTL